MIVVDASLATKWVLWEPGSVEALRFLRDHRQEFAGPDLMFTEVAGVVVRRANENKALHADAVIALRKWTVGWSEHLVRTYRVTQERLLDASRVALHLGHPLKDCIYLTLAIELQCELATCDAKFAPKARTLWPRVRILADYT